MFEITFHKVVTEGKGLQVCFRMRDSTQGGPGRLARVEWADRYGRACPSAGRKRSSACHCFQNKKGEPARFCSCGPHLYFLAGGLLHADPLNPAFNILAPIRGLSEAYTPTAI
jgi:hypothetical protein